MEQTTDSIIIVIYLLVTATMLFCICDRSSVMVIAFFFGAVSFFGSAATKDFGNTFESSLAGVTDLITAFATGLAGVLTTTTFFAGAALGVGFVIALTAGFAGALTAGFTGVFETFFCSTVTGVFGLGLVMMNLL